MTGAWAQACDRRRAVDGLIEDRPLLATVAVYIANAVEVTPDSEYADVAREYVEQAGMHLRAYRKSLPDQGRRGRDVGWYSGDRLLWAALGQISAIGRGRASVTGLRLAEACLRTWHKQQRRATR